MQPSVVPLLTESQARWKTSPVSRGEYARRRRIRLLEILAPDSRCAECGEQRPIDELQVDHVDGCTWNKNKLSRWSRVALYWREFAVGIPLRALCGSCNSSDGALRFRWHGRKRYA